jgi:hypothetical protein
MVMRMRLIVTFLPTLPVMSLSASPIIFTIRNLQNIIESCLRIHWSLSAVYSGLKKDGK